MSLMSESVIDKPHESWDEYVTLIKTAVCALVHYTDMFKSQIFKKLNVLR